MKKYLKNRYALTDKGAEGLLSAIKYSTLKSISYMLPVMLLMYVIQGLMALGDFRLVVCVIAFLVIALFMAYVVNKDYITTYDETYNESANLRIEFQRG